MQSQALLHSLDTQATLWPKKLNTPIFRQKLPILSNVRFFKISLHLSNSDSQISLRTIMRKFLFYFYWQVDSICRSSDKRLQALHSLNLYVNHFLCTHCTIPSIFSHISTMSTVFVGTHKANNQAVTDLFFPQLVLRRNALQTSKIHFSSLLIWGFQRKHCQDNLHKNTNVQVNHILPICDITHCTKPTTY